MHELDALLCFMEAAANPFINSLSLVSVPTDYLTWQDELDDADPEKRHYTRADFLRFDLDSVITEGNFVVANLMTNPSFVHRFEDGREDPASQELWSKLEKKRTEAWTDFPKKMGAEVIPQTSLTDKNGHGLQLISWLVKTFGGRVVLSKNSTQKKRKAEGQEQEKIFAQMTVDDLAFIFVQLEHNIDKWNYTHQAFKNEWIAKWKEFDKLEECPSDERNLGKEDYRKLQKINEWGYEFKTGEGLAGKFGRKRYNGITKFFGRAYFEKDKNKRELLPHVETNRCALQEEIEAHFSRERLRNNKAGGGDDSSQQPTGKKAKVAVTDHALDSFHSDAFDEALKNSQIFSV